MTIPTEHFSRRSLYRAVLALSLCAALPSASGPAVAAQPPHHEEQVNGGNLARADFARGRFEQDGGGWTEFGPGGETRFQFEETGRDEWSVYLLDRSRNFAIQLDVHRRMITLSVNGGRRTDLYQITDMAASPPPDFALRQGPGSAGKPDAAADDGPGDVPVGTFYRQQGRPTVMLQFDGTHYCAVQNQSQMSAYGGFGQVRVVPRLAMSGESTGVCGWPNGFYRRAAEPAVYRLHGRGALNLGVRACHVVNPRQMELFGGFGQLRVVEQSSDLFRGREEPGECADPGLSENGGPRRDLAQAATAAARGDLPLGPHSLQSVNYPGRYVRHAYSLGEIGEIQTPLDRADSTFVVVRGLNGRVGSISLESVNYPGHYLRHQNSRVQLAANDGSALFRDDATFLPRAGLAVAGTISLESANYPGRFISHRDSHLWLTANDGSDLFRQDASFRVRPPNDGRPSTAR